MHGVVFSFMRPQPIMRIGGMALTFTGFFAPISVLRANFGQLSIVALWFFIANAVTGKNNEAFLVLLGGCSSTTVYKTRLRGIKNTSTSS